ncbi:MAG: SDR family NAD(P)-dependent oxidoreductase [Planctomycetota bacterium]
MARELRGKVILISGASSGIGAATALACARQGMTVSLAARRADRLQQVALQVAKAGGKAHYFSCNVANEGDVRTWFEDAWSNLGRCDAVFANAGYGLSKPVLAHTDAEQKRMFEVNYFGTLRMVRYAMARFKATPDGLKHLLICSSAASEIGLPRLGPYSATKAAQDALASALRAELTGEGVSVSSVHPVGTQTEFFHVATGGAPDPPSNTPKALEQTPERVAKSVLACLRKPRPEVWPSAPARFALALATALPGFSARMMRKYELKQRESERGTPQPLPTDKQDEGSALAGLAQASDGGEAASRRVV